MSRYIYTISVATLTNYWLLIVYLLVGLFMLALGARGFVCLRVYLFVYRLFLVSLFSISILLVLSLSMQLTLSLASISICMISLSLTHAGHHIPRSAGPFTLLRFICNIGRDLCVPIQTNALQTTYGRIFPKVSASASKGKGQGSISPIEITHQPLIMKMLLQSILPLKLRRGVWLALWTSLHRLSSILAH